MRRVILAAVMVAATPAAAQTQQDIANGQFVEGRRMLAFNKKCGALDRMAATAVQLTVDDVKAQIPATALAAAETKARAAEAAAAAMDCKSPESQRLARVTYDFGREHRTVWIARAYAVAVLTSTERWAAGRSLLGTRVDRIAPSWIAMRAITPDAAQLAAFVKNEAELVYAAQCAAAPPSGVNRCPPSTLPVAQRPYADGWRNRVESFGYMLAEEQAKVAAANAPKLPPGAKGWGDVLAVRPYLTALEAGSGIGGSYAVRCLPGETVVVVAGPVPNDMLTRVKAKAYALGKPEALADLEVGRGAFTLEPRTKLTLPGFATMNALRPCEEP